MLLIFALVASCGVRPVGVRAVAVAPPPAALAAAETFDPPAIDFARTPDVDYCADDPSTCRPHGIYGAWIGNAVCIPEITSDFAGVPRPNRPPNTLFQGDTGCDLGAYQYVVNGPVPPPGAPTNLRQLLKRVVDAAGHVWDMWPGSPWNLIHLDGSYLDVGTDLVLGSDGRAYVKGTTDDYWWWWNFSTLTWDYVTSVP